MVNPLAREISAKVVYYGPGLSGKTTTLKHIFSVVKPQRRGELVTLATEGDRTIFFDFLPLHVKEVHGMGVRFQLYTVPGQVFYEATRKLVLSGADGIVFVADSQPSARQANAESLSDLRRNLSENDIDPERCPLVFQYNKRDLPETMDLDRMRADLNWRNCPDFSTSATNGMGVLGALKEISKRVIRSLWERIPKSSRPPRAVVSPLDEGIQAEVARVSATFTSSELLSSAVTSSGEFAVTEDPSPRSPIAMPSAGLSFASLWEGADAAPIMNVESAIADGEFGAALREAVGAMVELLEALPGTGDASPMSKAALLGLDGREFLRFLRLAGLHPTSVTHHDALFALYMLVSARVKATLIQ